MADMLVAQLVSAGDVMQKAGGDDHIHIRLRLSGGDVQRHAQHAVDVLAVMRAIGVAHALAHVGVQKVVLSAFQVQ